MPIEGTAASIEAALDIALRSATAGTLYDLMISAKGKPSSGLPSDAEEVEEPSVVVIRDYIRVRLVPNTGG